MCVRGQEAMSRVAGASVLMAKENGLRHACESHRFCVLTLQVTPSKNCWHSWKSSGQKDSHYHSGNCYLASSCAVIRCHFCPHPFINVVI